MRLWWEGGKRERDHTAHVTGRARRHLGRGARVTRLLLKEYVCARMHANICVCMHVCLLAASACSTRRKHDSRLSSWLMKPA